VSRAARRADTIFFRARGAARTRARTRVSYLLHVNEDISQGNLS